MSQLRSLFVVEIPSIIVEGDQRVIYEAKQFFVEGIEAEEARKMLQRQYPTARINQAHFTESTGRKES